MKKGKEISWDVLERIENIFRTTWRPRHIALKARPDWSCHVCFFTAHSMGIPEQNWEEGKISLLCILLLLSLCRPFMVLLHIAETRLGKYKAPCHFSILGPWQPSSVMALFPVSPSVTQMQLRILNTTHWKTNTNRSELTFRMVSTWGT